MIFSSGSSSPASFSSGLGGGACSAAWGQLFPAINVPFLCISPETLIYGLINGFYCRTGFQSSDQRGKKDQFSTPYPVQHTHDKTDQPLNFQNNNHLHKKPVTFYTRRSYINTNPSVIQI